MEKMRLSKLMAQRGLCSRREADRYITAGQALVDGVPVTVLGTRVCPTSTITLASSHKLLTFILNKPVGYVSCQPEPGKRPAIELLTTSLPKKLAVAGRLDIDSSGLLVFTEDGRIARQLIGPDSTVEKEYLVRVRGRPNLPLLRHGLSLDGRPLKPAIVEQLNEDQLRFVLTEGRKRQIRRMCSLTGLTVTGLKRVRVGHIRLSNLPLGRWRRLQPHECF